MIAAARRENGTFSMKHPETNLGNGLKIIHIKRGNMSFLDRAVYGRECPLVGGEALDHLSPIERTAAFGYQIYNFSRPKPRIDIDILTDDTRGRMIGSVQIYPALDLKGKHRHICHGDEAAVRKYIEWKIEQTKSVDGQLSLALNLAQFPVAETRKYLDELDMQFHRDTEHPELDYAIYTRLWNDAVHFAAARGQMRERIKSKSWPSGVIPQIVGLTRQQGESYKAIADKESIFNSVHPEDLEDPMNFFFGALDESGDPVGGNAMRVSHSFDSLPRVAINSDLVVSRRHQDAMIASRSMMASHEHVFGQETGIPGLISVADVITETSVEKNFKVRHLFENFGAQTIPLKDGQPFQMLWIVAESKDAQNSNGII